MPRELKDVYEFGPFRLDAEDGSLRRGGELVKLPPKAADVLVLLVQEPGVVRSRRELTSAVWDVAVEPASLDFQIHLIRRALGKNADVTGSVQTVPRRGFRFTGSVRRIRRQNDLSSEAPTQSLDNEAPGPAAQSPPEPPRAARGRWRGLVGAAAVVVIVVVSVLAGAALRPPEPLRILESKALQTDHPPSLNQPLLTDGRRLYYVPMTDYERRRALPIAGGESTDVFPRGSGFRLADVDRTGANYLAIRADPGRQGEVWVVPSPTGLPRRVGALAATDATWSPDGQRIALTVHDAAGHTRVTLADHDGSHVLDVDDPPGSQTSGCPQWSPDGAIVRFTASFPQAGVAADATIWEIRRDGTGLRPVLPDWDTTIKATCGAWSPDGGYFVFQGIRGDGRIDLWMLTEPTRLEAWLRPRPSPRPLSAGPLSLSGPVFSTDGRTLFAVGALRQAELVRWDRVTRTFVSYLGGLTGSWLSFSPDGQWVAYVGHPDRTLWRARADGTGRQALVTGDFELDGVAWSPDGRWIVFRSRMAGRRMKVFLIPASGGTPTPITEEDRDQGIATWSPDSTQLVFGDVPAQFGVPDGGETLHLYDIQRKTYTTVPGSEGLWTARWSRDGRYISALTIDREQRMKLHDTVTGRWRTLDAVHVNNPTWSHDHQFIYYDTEGGTYALRRVRVADGHVEELTALDFLPPPGPGWCGLTPDDSPLILRNPTGPAIYALTLERGR